MSHRGTKAKHEAEWRLAQRMQGYRDAVAGRQGQYSDMFYQRGWRQGMLRRKKMASTEVCRAMRTTRGALRPCTYLSSKAWFDKDFSGEWIPVCGVHGRTAERAGYEVRDLD